MRSTIQNTLGIGTGLENKVVLFVPFSRLDEFEVSVHPLTITGIPQFLAVCLGQK